MVKEQEKQEAMMKRMGARWKHRIISASFSAWKKNAKEQRSRRQLLNKFIDRISKAKLRDILLAWRHFAQHEVKQRAKNHLKEVRFRDEYPELRYLWVVMLDISAAAE